MKQIAILASGNGSNAEAIVHYFRSTREAEVALILTNKREAGVVERAERLGIPCHYFTNKELREGTAPLALMREKAIDLIVLAGYLCLITPIYIEVSAAHHQHPSGPTPRVRRQGDVRGTRPPSCAGGRQEPQRDHHPPRRRRLRPRASPPASYLSCARRGHTRDASEPCPRAGAPVFRSDDRPIPALSLSPYP